MSTYTFERCRCMVCGARNVLVAHGDDGGFNHTSSCGPWTVLERDVAPSGEGADALAAALRHPNGGETDQLLALGRRWNLDEVVAAYERDQDAYLASAEAEQVGDGP